MDEYSVRQSERYLLLRKHSGHSEGLAGYVCIGGFILLVSAFVFGTDEILQPGIGFSAVLGGGIYWLYARSENKRISQEIEGIKESFRRRGFELEYDGSIRAIKGQKIQ